MEEKNRLGGNKMEEVIDYRVKYEEERKKREKIEKDTGMQDITAGLM